MSDFKAKMHQIRFWLWQNDSKSIYEWHNWSAWIRRRLYHCCELLSFWENRVFCNLVTDRQTDKQTDRQTNRWTGPLHEAALAVASSGLTIRPVHLSVCLSVCHVLVVYRNDLTYHHVFFTVPCSPIIHSSVSSKSSLRNSDWVTPDGGVEYTYGM